MTKPIDHKKTVGKFDVDDLATELGKYVPPVKLPPLNPDHVRDALASVDCGAQLAALFAVHGSSVVDAVQAMADDPNYGATAKAWLLALPTGGR